MPAPKLHQAKCFLCPPLCLTHNRWRDDKGNLEQLISTLTQSQQLLKSQKKALKAE